MRLARFRRNKSAFVCLFLLASLVTLCIITPLLISQKDVNLNLSFKTPDLTHPFGCDSVGRDLFLRTFMGLRITLIVGLVAGLISFVIGTIYGSVSGFSTGTLDNIMMRIVDTLYGLPYLAYVMLFIAAFRGYSEVVFPEPQDRYLWDIFLIILALGSISWLTLARIVRAQVMVLKQSQFVEAAISIGATKARIISRHIIPNLLGPVIVYVTLTMPTIMLFESFLSFLGLGIQEPHASLGNLLDDGIKRIAAGNINWWMIIFPGSVLAIVLFCVNSVGDGLRDALDVK